MEKIKPVEYHPSHDETIFAMFNKINEIIDVFDIVFESLRRKEDRLKTLEDKVKFIMENSTAKDGIFAIFETMDSGKAFKIGEPLYIKTLQDLYNVENKMTEFKFNPPVEIETGVEYEVKTNVKEYPCKCDCHNKMTKEELYPDNKPIANCGLCCLDESTVKECDCDCHNNIAHHIDERCKCMPYNKSEKIEEELGTLITGDYAYGHKMSEEEWDKFNKMRKDKKIEEIISELNYRFLDRYRGIIFPNGYRPYDYLQNIESWLRDKLKELCK